MINHSTPTPIVSADGTLLGVLAGHMDPKDWQRLHKEGMDALESARKDSSQVLDGDNHRRGNFSILRCGVSHGSGQKRPCNLSNNKTNAAILEKLNAMEVFGRIAGFTSCECLPSSTLPCSNLLRVHSRHVELGSRPSPLLRRPP